MAFMLKSGGFLSAKNENVSLQMQKLQNIWHQEKEYSADKRSKSLIYKRSKHELFGYIFLASLLTVTQSRIQ